MVIPPTGRVYFVLIIFSAGSLFPSHPVTLVLCSSRVPLWEEHTPTSGESPREKGGVGAEKAGNESTRDSPEISYCAVLSFQSCRRARSSIHSSHFHGLKHDPFPLTYCAVNYTRGDERGRNGAMINDYHFCLIYYLPEESNNKANVYKNIF